MKLLAINLCLMFDPFFWYMYNALFSSMQSCILNLWKYILFFILPSESIVTYEPGIIWDINIPTLQLFLSIWLFFFALTSFYFFLTVSDLNIYFLVDFFPNLPFFSPWDLSCFLWPNRLTGLYIHCSGAGL